MNGFWALMHKELQEQRRTWKFLAMAGIFTALALLISIIPFIVTKVRGDPQGPEEARELLMGFGFSVFGLGTLLAIIVAMGSLANERASGTAAMTLSKPVTRAAFVGTKFLGLVHCIFGALVIGSVVMYLLTLMLFDNGGLARFAGSWRSWGSTWCLSPPLPSSGAACFAGSCWREGWRSSCS